MTYKYIPEHHSERNLKICPFLFRLRLVAAEDVGYTQQPQGRRESVSPLAPAHGGPEETRSSRRENQRIGTGHEGTCREKSTLTTIDLSEKSTLHTSNRKSKMYVRP